MLRNPRRGLVEGGGGRFAPAPSESFAARVSAEVPGELGTATQPLLRQIAGLTAEIRDVDQVIEKLTEPYPEIRILRTVPGVGPVIAAAYVLTLDGSMRWSTVVRWALFWACVPSKASRAIPIPSITL